MSKRSHRNRHHGRPGRAPAAPSLDECAFAPCAAPLAWLVAGPTGPGGIGLAYVCDGHLTESIMELGRFAEPAVAPLDQADELLAFVEEFTASEAIRHAS